ncbi:MAG: FtsX-like permease family protein [Longimicrobiales bacterium]
MKPPAAARILVRVFSDPEDRAFLIRDLADRFDDVLRTEGPRAARRWYWVQALSAVPWTMRQSGDRLRWRSFTGVVGDLRFGFRTLWRNPLYAAGVTGTLGLGVGAATLTFAVAWRVWLAPMPYPDPDRVVRLYELEPGDAAAETSQGDPESRRHRFSPTLLEDFRDHRFQTISVVSTASVGQIVFHRDGEAHGVSRATLSPGGFGILGIVPMLGRLPVDSQTELLLSDVFWRTEFGADPNIVGSTLPAGGRSFRIVGVARLPAGFPGDVDVVDVTDFGDTEDRDFRYVEAIARVRPGRSVAEAAAEASAFVTALAETHPEHRGWGVEAIVLAEDLVRPFRGVLALLLAAGTIFLILACVNVMGLVAARRVEGRHDRSIRLALGASEGRIFRGSLIESLVLTLLGSTAGVLSAAWLIGSFRAVVPFYVPRLAEADVSRPLVSAGLGVGVAVGVLVGAVGYLVSRGAKPSVGRAPVWRAVGSGGRGALVVSQVALTTLLTAGGAAVVHRVATLQAIDLGFEPEGVSTTSTFIRDVPENRSREQDARWTFSRKILDRFEQMGISAATAINTPMSGEVEEYDIPQLSIRTDDSSREIVYDFHPVSPNYFSVMGIALIAGRDFSPEDHASSRRVVIVSEGFAFQYLARAGKKRVESIIGRVLQPLYGDTTGPMVVGVVESTRHRSPEAPIEPDIYSPLSQLAFDPVTLLVRGEPEEVGDAVAGVLAQVHPEQRWSPLIPYTSHLREWFAPLRLQLLMIGVLGALGLVLASLGLYSLMAYQVATRRQEIGIRKAVGATDGRLVWGVLGNSLTLTTVGAVLGLGAWYRLLPATRELIDGISSGGYVVPLTVALIVGGSCVLATLVPALRASRVDPVVTLKSE